MAGSSTQLRQQEQPSGRSISEKLSSKLGEINRVGTFCSHGSLSPVLPGLDVSGIGPVAFPLTPIQAEQIKRRCEQAPYGHGELTLLDTGVRQVWRMTPDLFQLTNPEWQEFLTRITSTVEQDLGLEGQKLQSHLYDLLLYEKGSFFLPHRDGEKLDRMVATLIVVLPSAFQGGELIVRHEGQEQKLDFGNVKNSSFQTHFAGFYADCEHEVLPLRDGYRLCLVYNLTLATSKKSITAPCNQEHIASITSLLEDWSVDSSENSPCKLAIRLEHQYTQDGLSWDTLKGLDRTKAQVIREAARRAGCKVHLAQLTFWEQGSAEYYGEPSRGRWYHDDPPGAYEMEEVFDWSLTAEHWMDNEENRLQLDPMTVLEEEVVPEGALKAIEPEEAFEGYTGNAGMTLERWYRHAAIFLWPEKRHFQILCDCGTDSAVTVLNLLMHKWQNANSSEQPGLKAQCLEFATRILSRWTTAPYFDPEGDPNPKTSQIVPTLELLESLKLIKTFLSEVMPTDASVELSTALLKVCERFGWSNFQNEFESIFRSTTLPFLGRNVRLLEQLCSEDLCRSEERLELCRLLAQELLSALVVIDREKVDWRTSQFKRTPVLVGLVRALVTAEQFETLARLTTYTVSTPSKYSLTPVVVETILELQDWLPKHVKQQCAITDWIEACRKHLQFLTAQMPEKPVNFHREANISCPCADCKELIAFLKSPTEQLHGFRVRKDRRQHLHQIIEKHRCDVDHVTERKGSPQTLVCTKNVNSFDRSLHEYKKNKEHLAALQSIDASLLSVQ